MSVVHKYSGSDSIWKVWLAAALWLGLIVIESTAVLSAENTGSLLYPVLHFLFGLNQLDFPIWHFYIRKTGHVVGYAVLSILLFRAWRATLPAPARPRWSIVWSRIAFFMTALVASLDEWHQTFLPSRTGNIRDVLLDITAALVAQIFLLLSGWRSARPGVGRGQPFDGAEEESVGRPESSTVGN